ncbi:Predicted arabinose efflux permease, MFS family [Enhydrobacter aerosaccus]|uniref:Predicted arabinose efflux permease, MFS family n=1 Tax=Enhydrobacter aerosaccus TaxID=225324 RepID=A0A1T4L3G1_9HYPH|nr:MFS transporter [Enhydrobacter aerosaccus]SJZ49128.1 Predicted arabinose efflux permease, MFS family [Enhydrobacter aerosaccus]
MAAGIVAAFHVGKMPPALPSVRADLGATLREAGWLLSVINLMTAVGGMAIALTADRFGHRRLILLGTAICLAASLFGSFVNDIAELLVCRFFEGLGFIATTVSAPPLLLRVTKPSDARRAMALWTTYMPAGAGIMMLSAAMILPHASWRLVWLVAAAASGLMLVALLRATLVRKELGPNTVALRPLAKDVGDVLSNGGLVAIALCFGAYSSCWFAIVGFLPTLQIERLGLSPSSAAVITALVTFVNVAGNLAAGVLLGRGVPRIVLIVGAALPMAFCAAGIFVDGTPDVVRLVLAAVYSMIIGVVPGALFTAIPVHAPRRQLVGAATGLLMQGSNIGALLGPPATAALVSSAGWPAASWLTTITLSTVVVSGIFLHWRERRKLSS